MLTPHSANLKQSAYYKGSEKTVNNEQNISEKTQKYNTKIREGQDFKAPKLWLVKTAMQRRRTSNG